MGPTPDDDDDKVVQVEKSGEKRLSSNKWSYTCSFIIIIINAEEKPAEVDGGREVAAGRCFNIHISFSSTELL